MSNNLYHELVSHYEDCLEKYGNNHQGVDWPNKKDLVTRYNVILEIINHLSVKKGFKLLDLGCGYGGIIDFLDANNFNKEIKYHGIDLSKKMIESAKKEYPNHSFEARDILVNNLQENSFDVIIMNGVFTEKRSLTEDEMYDFFKKMIAESYKACKQGIAFNVMSKNVDWERDDLFHLSFDKLSQFLCKNVSRDFIFRSDYKLYEYTCYVFKR